MESRNSGLRTADVARGVGYSVQQVRNLERAGVLPPAPRTGSGYRMYTDEHVRAARAYRELAAGVGPMEAKSLLRGVHQGPMSEVLARLDAAHAKLHDERRELNAAKRAALTIAGEAIGDVRPSDSMSIGELANALGVRTSTLRHWDAERLVVPDRPSSRAPRNYSPRDVRDARIVHELRRAGYRIGQLQKLMPDLRGRRSHDELLAALGARDASITARSQALLHAAAALDGLVDAFDHGRSGGAGTER